ncbi:MAG: adenylosuccinate lyase, partial [Chloroflexi bacterium]|nr:adenylosuccinate lyase [Chloroflexota bacterium]
LEVTRGLIFSQRVLTELIEKKGMSRQQAYEIVQRNSMRAWKNGEAFLTLLQADPDVTLTREELKKIFDYNYYLKNVDAIFQRVGLA